MREIILDTETTGLDPKAGHRIIELACLKLVNHMPTGRHLHHYIDPERDVPADAPIMREEVFGPVTPVQSFATTEEALALANATEYGLAAFVWTRDHRTAMRVSEQLEFGLVGVNDWYPVTAEAPFGGFKQSGLGRESGSEGVHEYVEVKTRYFGGLE